MASQPKMYEKQRQRNSSSAAAETFMTGPAVDAGLRTERLENFTDSRSFRHLIFRFEVFDNRLLLSHRSLTEELIGEK